LFVYLNGMYQDEGTDYVVTGSTVSVLSAMGATTGDVLEVRYAIGGIAVAPGTLGIFDDFDRADGPTDVPDRADGGLWTVVGSDWELADGRLIRTSGGVGSPISSYWVYADYGYTATVSVQSINVNPSGLAVVTTTTMCSTAALAELGRGG
jgi:hypothetical protein